MRLGEKTKFTFLRKKELVIFLSDSGGRVFVGQMVYGTVLCVSFFCEPERVLKKEAKWGVVVHTSKLSTLKEAKRCKVLLS